MKSFAVAEGREAKARKIDAVLQAARGDRPVAGMWILDIGTGSGHIAAHFAPSNIVVACDIEDHLAVEKDGFDFIQINGSQLPFPDAQFDIVILNHVLTYVPDQRRELVEVRRLLKPGGICFISMPNRWFPIEPHSRTPLIHYLPEKLYSNLLRWITGEDEIVRMHTPRGMRQLFHSAGFEVHDYTVDILRDPTRFRDGKGLRLPGWRWLALLAPTNVFVLRTAALK